MLRDDRDRAGNVGARDVLRASGGASSEQTYARPHGLKVG